jgi:PAS domain S-box-containing protein
MAIDWAREDRKQAVMAAEAHLRNTLAQIAADDGEAFERVAPVLEALADLPEIKALDASRCDGAMRAIRDGAKRFAGLVLADASGRVICNGRRSSTTTYRGDRADFRRVMETRRAAVGEYTVGRESYQRVIHFGQPVFGTGGTLVGVLTASLSVEQLNGYLAHIPLPSHHVLALTDPDGRVLASQPGGTRDMGEILPRSRSDRLQSSEGLIEDADLLFARMPLSGSGLVLWLGAKKTDVTRSADIAFRRALGIGLAMAIATALLIWLTGLWLLRWPLRRLTRATQRIASGDFGLGPSEAHDPGELGELGRALKEMAAKLAAREAALTESEVRFRTTFENAAVGVAHVACDGHWLRVNEKLCQITGYRRDELLALRVQDITHPDDVAGGREGIARLLAGDVPSYARRKRCLRKDGTMIWVSVTTSLLRKPDGSPDYLISVIQDISKEKQAEAGLEVSRAMTESILRSLKPRIAVIDRDGRIIAVNDAWQAVTPKRNWVGVGYLAECERAGGRGDQQATETFRGIREVLAGTAREFTLEYQCDTVAGSRWFAMTATPLVGRWHGAVIAHDDITERKAAEEHVQLLLREVSHRAKNLLAVVQAVARQTAGEDDPREFARLFSARLASLAASHDLLVKSDWRGVSLAQLIRSQLAPFSDLIGTRIVLCGPDLTLTPAAAQTLGMTLHELATNASKYGALTNADGMVRVNWEVAAAASVTRFQMCWHESNGLPVTPPHRQGFGHQVMVQMVEHTLDAAVALQYLPSGLVWSVEAPTRAVLEEAMQGGQGVVTVRAGSSSTSVWSKTRQRCPILSDSIASH